MTKRRTYPRRGIHGEVVHTIGLRILRGELQPGDPLPTEEELNADRGYSRTVLREAVRVLAAKGLVHAQPKTGTRVRPRSEWNIADPDVLAWRVEAGADSELYQQVTEVRIGIEPQAARLSAERATDERDRGDPGGLQQQWRRVSRTRRPTLPPICSSTTGSSAPATTNCSDTWGPCSAPSSARCSRTRTRRPPRGGGRCRSTVRFSRASPPAMATSPRQRCER